MNNSSVLCIDIKMTPFILIKLSTAAESWLNHLGRLNTIHLGIMLYQLKLNKNISAVYWHQQVVKTDPLL